MASQDLLTSSRIPYAATITATVTAASVGSPLQTLVELIIQADPNNTVDVLLGNATTQCWRLQAGDTISWPIKNPALIYARTESATAVVNVVGRGGD